MDDTGKPETFSLWTATVERQQQQKNRLDFELFYFVKVKGGWGLFWTFFHPNTPKATSKILSNILSLCVCLPWLNIQYWDLSKHDLRRDWGNHHGQLDLITYTDRQFPSYVPYISFYPDFIQFLSSFYSDFLEAPFILVLSRFYPESILFFFEKSG